MKILVTGASGFIGSAICHSLLGDGHRVVGLTHSRTTARSLRERGIEPLVGDMRDETVLGPAAAEAEVTVLCAQLVFQEQRYTRRRMMEAADAELRSLLAVVSGARERHGRIVYTASSLAFGVGADGWTDESCGFAPLAVARGKAAASQRLLALVAEGQVAGCVIAPGVVYGPGGTFADFASAISRGKVRLSGTGGNYWSPVRVDDLAAAYVRTLDGRADGKALLVVDDQPMQMREVARVIAQAVGVEPPGTIPKFVTRIFAGSPFVDTITASRRCRNQRAKEVLDWQPRFPALADGLPGILDEALEYRRRVRQAKFRRAGRR